MLYITSICISCFIFFNDLLLAAYFISIIIIISMEMRFNKKQIRVIFFIRGQNGL